jgi:S1-C subfamily serine protease
MRLACALAVVLAWSGVSFGQSPSVLHVKATLRDAAGTATPLARHALLISDNPSTSEPRRVLTAMDGTVDVRLRPGSYTVESDRPHAFLGQAYQWTQIVEVAAGRETTLELTSDNAEVVPLSAASTAGTVVASETGALALLAKWQQSVVAIWSPTSRATGFVVDDRGLIATSGSVVGNATAVEVQLGATLKVPARVLASSPLRDVALVWVDPGAIEPLPPLPLTCPPAAPALDYGQEIVTIGMPLRTSIDVTSGEVTALQPRAIETDLRLSFGGAGGPVFNGAGTVVGLTSAPLDEDARASRNVAVVRAVTICEALVAARQKLSGAAPPEPTRLPVEPTRPYPADALEDSTRGNAGSINPPVASSADFDVAFITPPMVHAGRLRSGWTGGRSTRSPEAEARIGRLTEFSAWSDYFAEVPPVLVVRVTPKMVEGFWKRLAREAARTQGAALPAFKDFKTDFLRMRASCAGAEVAPIHPFVLEHRVSEKDVIREGLYVFDPESFGPHCSTVTLSVYSDKAPEKADVLTIDAKVIEQIWRDFAPYRASAR